MARPKLHSGPYRKFIDDLLGGTIKAEKLHDNGAGPWTYVDPYEDDVVALGGLYISLNGTDPGLPVVAGGLGYGTWARVAQGLLLLGVDENTVGRHVANLTLGSALATPTGAVSAPVFTGTPLGIHAHELPVQLVSGTSSRQLASTVFGTGTSRAAQSSQVETANTTSAPVALSQAVSAGTPAGTISAPTFTGVPMPLVPPSLTVYMWTRTA